MSTPLKNNTTSLLSLLDDINALPERLELPELTNPAGAAQILEGYEAIDETGQKVIGTMLVTSNGDEGGSGSGGTFKAICFTIDGAPYPAEEGMTWTEWIASEYNTIGCYELGANVTFQNSETAMCHVQYNGADVTPNNTIISGAAYTSYNTGIEEW